MDNLAQDSSLHIPLLVTKCSIPPLQNIAVARPHLLAKLNQGRQRKLTLVSTPAGSGKTTLLSAWASSQQSANSPSSEKPLASSAYPIAWLTLDQDDNFLPQFLNYLVVALETIAPGIGEPVSALLQLPQSPPVEVLLTTLSNALASILIDFTLVLDDYQCIEAQTVHDALTFLLNHLPARMHLLIASRTALPLPLARLRAQKQLLELQAADLRFTAEETADFFRAMDLDLSLQQATELERRTEGWITGLQLAALSLQGRQDVAGFIATFTGSHRYILDYLVEEVFSRQTPQVQTFLLQTSILKQMTAGLCDAVTGRNDSQKMLEMLEQANLFLIPMDEQRYWYRYHQLFAQFMVQRLQQTLTELVAELHQRAALWYEQHGLLVIAVTHALNAGDFTLSARLVESAAETMLVRGEVAQLSGWLAELPAELVQSRSRLCLIAAWASTLMGHPEQAEPWLLAAEQRRLEAGNAAEVRAMLGEIHLLYATLASITGNPQLAIEHAQKALADVPQSNLTLRGLIAQTLGTAYQLTGDVSAASQALTEATTINLSTHNIYAAFTSMSGLAHLQAQQGQLHLAAQTFRQALQMEDGAFEKLPAAGLAYVGLGNLFYEWNDLNEATALFKTGIERGEQGQHVGILITGYGGLLRVKLARDDRSGAHEMLQKMEQLAQHYQTVPQVAELVATHKAYIQIAEGKNTEVLFRLAQNKHETAELSELQQRTLARLYLMQKQPAKVLGIVEPCLPEAERQQRLASLIDLLLLKALALHATKQTPLALNTLAQVLRLTEPEGYIRSFVDQGPALIALLMKIYDAQQKRSLPEVRGIAKEYVRVILVAFNAPELPEDGEDTISSLPLLEPLSTREIEVLQRLAAGASNREIAEELCVSLGTVKKHLNNIFGKLAVSSRTQAIVRAKTLKLLD